MTFTYPLLLLLLFKKMEEEFQLRYLPDLIAQKCAGTEQAALKDADVAFHREEYERLRCQLEEASQLSALPEVPSGKEALNALLVRVRMASI